MPSTVVVPYRNNLLLAFFTSLVCMCGTYLFFGFYYVEYEGLNTALFSGKLTPGFPFQSFYFIGNMGTSYFYSFLYQHAPGIEWLSWIYSSYLFISCLIGIYLVMSLLPSSTTIRVKVCVSVAVYLLVFADHHMHFIYTRVAYMCAGLSLVGLVAFFNHKGDIKARPWLFVALNIFFTIGALTRVEAATACLALTLFFAAFYLQDNRRLIRMMIYPIVLILSLSIGISLNIEYSTQFYKQIEPDIEAQFIERENRAPISIMTTHRDSVLYNTAADLMWSDPRVITPDFLRKMILHEGFIFTDARQWHRVYRDITEILSKYWYLALLNIFLAIALFFQYDFRGSRLGKLYWLAFEGSFWALTLAQTYTFKINERSFLPLLSLFLFCHIVMITASLRKPVSRWWLVISVPLGLLFLLHVSRLHTESQILQTDLANYRSNTQKIERVAKDRYLVLNSSSFDFLFLGNVPFHPFDFSAFKKIYITDGYIIPFIPDYRRYLEKECHCNMESYLDFLNYLRSIHSNIVIVSTTLRINTIQTYLTEIYKYQFPIREDTATPLLQLEKRDHRNKFNDLRVYLLD